MLAIVVRVFDPRGSPGRIDAALVTGLSVMSLGPRWIAELCKFDPPSHWLMILLSPSGLFGVLALAANIVALLDWLFSPRFDWRQVVRYAMGIVGLAGAALFLEMRSELSFSLGHVEWDRPALGFALALGVVLFGATRLATVRRVTT